MTMKSLSNSKLIIPIVTILDSKYCSPVNKKDKSLHSLSTLVQNKKKQGLTNYSIIYLLNLSLKKEVQLRCSAIRSLVGAHISLGIVSRYIKSQIFIQKDSSKDRNPG